MDKRRRSASLLLLVAVWLALMAAVAIVPACRPTPAAPLPGAPPSILLLGCDGATWSMLRPAVRRGLAPASERLAAGGTTGQLRSIMPMISPAIWTSIVTGVEPARHGIQGFVASSGGDLSRAGRMNTSLDRRRPAIWNLLSRRGRSAAVVGWWCSWPAEPVRGAVVSMLAWPYLERRDSRPPDDRPLAELPRLCYPEVWQTEALLDARAPEAIPAAEAAARHLPARPWYHAKDRSAVDQAVRLLARFQPDFLAVYVQGVDVVSHACWGEPQVVADYYRIADGFWDELAALAGAGASVLLVSDHGFCAREERFAGQGRAPERDCEGGRMPFLLVRPPGVHAPLGVLVAAGPSVRRGARLVGAGVLDMLPTMLPLLDLPVPSGMDGTPLAGLLEPEFLASHPIEFGGAEAAEPDAAPPELEADDPAEGLKERLRSIGYVF